MTSSQPSESILRLGLLIGPGDHAVEVGSVLTVLAATRRRTAQTDAPPALAVVRLEDLDELLAGDLASRLAAAETSAERRGTSMPRGREGGELAAGSGSLVLEADRVPLEDIGIVRRFLERRQGWRLVVLANDPTRDEARALQHMPRSQWLPWPPNLDQLAALLTSSAETVGAPEETGMGHTTDTAAQSDELADELAPTMEVPDAQQPQAEPATTPTFATRELLTPDPPTPALDQPFEPEGVDAPSRAVFDEPDHAPRPTTSTELGGLVEELLAGDALAGSESPRYLFRCDDSYPVVGDRAELSQSLSGLLGLARRAAGASGVVSVLVGPLADARGVLLRVDFPPGDLGDSGIDELLERAEAGAHDPSDRLGQALAFAARAAEQLRELGAEPNLAGLEDGRLRLSVEFPPLPPDAALDAPALETHAQGAERDPFA